MPGKKSRKSTVVLSIFLVISLLLSSGLGVFCYYQYQQIQGFQNTLDSIVASKVQDAINPVKSQLDDAKSQIASGEQTIEALKKENEALTKQVEELKKNWLIKQEENLKVAYLTFDDGPSQNTERILDILKEYDVKATFFVVGKDSPYARKMYQRMIEEGHTIGNHTYSHVYKDIYASADAFKQNVQKLDQLIFDATGTHTKIIRFPGGSNTTVPNVPDKKAFMQQLVNDIYAEGYINVDWNVDSTDSKVVHQPKNIIVSQVLNQCSRKKKAIILMHDAPVKETTVEALPDIIKGLKDQGFIFRHIDEYTINVQFLKPQITIQQ